MPVLVPRAELVRAACSHALCHGRYAGFEGVLGVQLLQPGQRSRLQQQQIGWNLVYVSHSVF